MEDFPPLVARAHAVARKIGFPLTRDEARHAGPSTSLPGAGRFLAMLAAGCVGGVIGELGTAIGMGAAWIASAMPDDCKLITVEIDQERARLARELLAEDPRVEVDTGDAVSVLSSRGSFDLLFSDGGGPDHAWQGRYAAHRRASRQRRRYFAKGAAPRLAVPRRRPQAPGFLH
jgi:predicted O-methyltransferase YrrM